MSAHDLIERVRSKIDKSQKLVWIRDSDGKIIISSLAYILFYTKKKWRWELDWYTQEKPFHSNYAQPDSFVKHHTLIGEL